MGSHVNVEYVVVVLSCRYVLVPGGEKASDWSAGHQPWGSIVEQLGPVLSLQIFSQLQIPSHGCSRHQKSQRPAGHLLHIPGEPEDHSGHQQGAAQGEVS